MANLPKIGVLGLSLKLYDTSAPNLKSGRECFVNRVIERMHADACFDFPGACNTKEAVDEAVKQFESKGMDAVLVVFLTYAPSLIALPALKNTRLPIIIWNTQEASGVPFDAMPVILQENHGVHGVQDLCAVLKRSGVNFKVISGHWENDRTLDALRSIYKTVHTISCLYNAKIGLLGYPMQDMGDFNVDETALLNRIGPSVIHVPVDEYVDFIKETPENSIREIIQKDKEMFQLDGDITEEEHRASAKAEWGIRKIIEKYRLQGWCQHFAVLGACPGVPTIPFLAASKLMGEGISYAAEGDVCGAAAGVIMNCLTGNSSLAEMFTVDFNDNTLFMRHMGELNVSMAKKTQPVRVIRRKFALANKMCPPTPVFSLEPGETTLVSLTTGPNGEFQVIAVEGEVVDTPVMIHMDSPYFKWRPSGKLEDFLDGYAEAGGSHHLSLGYGRAADMIKILAGYLKIKYVHI